MHTRMVFSDYCSGFLVFFLSFSFSFLFLLARAHTLAFFSLTHPWLMFLVYRAEKERHYYNRTEMVLVSFFYTLGFIKKDRLWVSRQYNNKFLLIIDSQDDMIWSWLLYIYRHQTIFQPYKYKVQPSFISTFQYVSWSIIIWSACCFSCFLSG